MKRRRVAALVAALALAPATLIVLQDLYTCFGAASSTPQEREFARALVWGNVAQARHHAAQVNWLNSGSGSTNLASIKINAAGPLALDIPTCPEAVLTTERPKLEHVARLSVRAVPIRLPMRLELTDDRERLVMSRSLSQFQLALLDACLRASPFAGYCGDWLDRRPPDRAAVVAELEKSGILERRSGAACWILPEFAMPE